MQAMLFPLTDEEFKDKALGAVIQRINDLEEEKDRTSRDFNERIKKAVAEMKALAKEVREEQAWREPNDDEAPWQGLVDEADDIAHGRRPRRTARRGPDGELSTTGGAQTTSQQTLLVNSRRSISHAMLTPVRM